MGEEVYIQVNENNAVIDVHRKGDRAHTHRFVTGNLAYASPDRKEIKVWTPEGEEGHRCAEQAGPSCRHWKKGRR
ncbi:MAG: hypothetical protein MRJ92_13110 [Nitrospira sp.]|nr:hypothetical protein [Nitrospira sp.]